jgi:hypothetical protein
MRRYNRRNSGASVMSRLIGVLAIAALVAFSGQALAAPGTDPNPDKGKDNGYGSQPGAQQAQDVGAQCGSGAASGAFGVYSHGVVPTTYPTPRGADGQQTGLNNSAVCGNRQGNLP